MHAATRGAAEGLARPHEVGHLDAFALANVVMWDWAVGAAAEHRAAMAPGAVPGMPAQTLHRPVFAWMTLGDERNAVATYVAGTQQGRNEK